MASRGASGTAGSSVVATWFVADTPETATFFPQVGERSDSPAAQSVYWRCVACFFASSLVQNPEARHMLFANTRVPRVDGIDLSALLARWNVEVVTLPITYRLPPGTVASWGNQFYIFDVMQWLAEHPENDRALVLDSDCLFLSSIAPIEQAVDRYGALTYTLDHDEHPEDEAINGLDRTAMARFAGRHGAALVPAIPYHGGEIYAATHATTERLMTIVRDVWPHVVAGAPDAPREEAHLLSIAYAIDGRPAHTANGFIRRIWTTFKRNNATQADFALPIWHVPGEKRSGFAKLFARVTRDPALDPRTDAVAMGLTIQEYGRALGIPRRRIGKLVTDASTKLLERIRR